MKDGQVVKSPVDIDALPTLTTEEWRLQHGLDTTTVVIDSP